MKSFFSILINGLFFLQSGQAATNTAFQNIKPILNIEQGQTQKTKFKDFIESLPEAVRQFPDMDNFIKYRGDEMMTLSRSEFVSKGRKYARILISFSGQSMTIEIPENADALHGDAVVQIGKAKFRIGDFGDLSKTMKIWHQQDPEFVERVALNETFRFLDPEVWKKLKPEVRVTLMIHLRGMATDIEQILKRPHQSDKKKKTAKNIYSAWLNEAFAEGGDWNIDGSGVVGNPCSAGGYTGTYQQSGFCGIAGQTVGFQCGGGRSPCNPLFYRKTNGTRGLCVDVPHPSTDNVSALCDASNEGIKVSNFEEAENFVRAYLRNENQTATGFAGNLGQLQGDEKAKLESYKAALEAAMNNCRMQSDNLSTQNCTSLSSRISLLQRAISGDSRGALTRGADWLERKTSDALSGIGKWVQENPWWTAGIAAVIGTIIGLFIGKSMASKKKTSPPPPQPVPQATNPLTPVNCSPVTTCCVVGGTYSIYPNGCCGGGTAVSYNPTALTCTGTTNTTPQTTTPTTENPNNTASPSGEITTTTRKGKDAPAVLKSKARQ